MYAFDQSGFRKKPARLPEHKRTGDLRGMQACTSLSSSGSNQARKGRLVNALAVRGDEGRDTLR